MVAASTSWGNYLIVLLIVALVVPVWIFSLQDIFRRKDLSDRSKAWWSAAVILLPVLGTLAYLLYLNARPPHATPEEGSTIEADGEFVARSAAEGQDRELKVLSDLHDRGRLTDDEFAAEKERVLTGAGLRSDG